MKDFFGGAGGDRPGDRLRMQGLEGGFVVVRGDDAAHDVWGTTGRYFDRSVFFMSRGLEVVTTRR